MTNSTVTLSVLAAIALMAAGCDRQTAEPRPPVQAAAPDWPAADRVETGRADPRDAPVAQIDGKPMWAANSRYTAQENAEYQFERNGEAFEAKTVDDFVRKVHAFAARPPAGTERFERANGDLLLYDPKSNVFAVYNADGAPRTMFKPDDGPSYWAQQKAPRSSQESRPTRDAG